MTRLFESIGHTSLFEESQTLGKIGFRVSGHSDARNQFPVHWKLTALGDDRKAEITFLPNLRDVCGDFGIKSFDRTIPTHVTYTPSEKLWSKRVEFSENAAVRFNAVPGGSIFRDGMAELKYNHAFGRLHTGFDFEVPLDRSIRTSVSGQIKLDWDNYFVAAHLPEIAETQLPDLKAGYEDKYFSAILSTGDLKKYEFCVTKGTDANTLIGVKTDFGDNYKIGFEHVLSDSSELKLGVSNKDLLDVQYVKQFPGITATFAAQCSKFITTGQPQDLKVGLGLELDL
ncbi:Oidioi.mRNA.OKI2018_I69.chr1.g1654.t1.cds [Oikopleura dioica]|uniref:Oidioi.mRNA.OKI2018_I69.chr1.g1654.t1.cds n=1 Tax=Oikopleura dioica TaxID=34765 RepID=A0ABN7SS30_OIKDI|nr:Oidioi.mRNA.OKI2018_I69.chr1.g1654.t1.cds [Oikopleura dioica]